VRGTLLATPEQSLQVDGWPILPSESGPQTSRRSWQQCPQKTVCDVTQSIVE